MTHNLSWFMGVLFMGGSREMTRARMGVEVLGINEVESILFLREIGPCIVSL